MNAHTDKGDAAGPRLPVRPTGSAWPAATACLALCALTAFLLRAYGLLHGKIIATHYTTLEAPLKTDLFRLLGYLGVNQLTGLLAAGFAAWTFYASPAGGPFRAERPGQAGAKKTRPACAGLVSRPQTPGGVGQ